MEFKEKYVDVDTVAGINLADVSIGIDFMAEGAASVYLKCNKTKETYRILPNDRFLAIQKRTVVEDDEES